MTVSYDVPSLADELLDAQAVLSPADQRIGVEFLRLLAQGAPVDVDELARASGLAPAETASALGRWPGVERDGADRVIGFGLTLEPTQHVVEIDGVRLYAWCALDTLAARNWTDRVEGAFAVAIHDGSAACRRRGYSIIPPEPARSRPAVVHFSSRATAETPPPRTGVSGGRERPRSRPSRAPTGQRSLRIAGRINATRPAGRVAQQCVLGLPVLQEGAA